MKFSFITPEPRPLLSIFSKLWLSLIGFVFVVLLVANFFIVYKNYSTKKNIEFLATSKKSLVKR